MKDVSFLPGVAVATGLIGPVVAIAAVLVIAAAQGARLEALVVAPLIVMFAIPIGIVASALPNLAGAALLAWLGRGNIAMRLPVMWALAGAGAGAALVGAFSGSAEPGSMALLATIGTVSALLCRWKTVWTDDDMPREASDGQDRTHPAHPVARPRRHATDRWLD